MEKTHIARLAGVCRLCCGKIKIDKKYLNPKQVVDFEKEICKVFSYEISNDTDGLHPPNICDVCRRKLNRTSADSRDVVSQKISIFKEHEIDCKLCFSSCGLEKHVYSIKFIDSVVSKLLTMEDIVFLAESSGLKITHDDKSTIFTRIKLAETAVIDLSVKIHSDFSWNLFMFECEIPLNGSITENLPQILTLLNYETFFTILASAKCCSGNDDFPDIISHHISKGTELVIYDQQKNIKANIENNRCSNAESLTTIRTIDCELLIPSSQVRCDACKSHRRVLNIKTQRLKDFDPDIVKKTTPNIHMTRPQLSTKLEAYQKDRRSLLRNRERSENKIKKLIKKESVVVDESTHEIVSSVLDENQSGFDENSPKHLLWEHQKKMSMLKTKTSMCWHPVLIRWCLSIYLRSPGRQQPIIFAVIEITVKKPYGGDLFSID